MNILEIQFLFLQSYANFTNIFVPRCDLLENLEASECGAIEDPRSIKIDTGLFQHLIN